MSIEEVLTNTLQIHTALAKKPSNAFRGHDKETPYGVHPILGGLMILEDSKGIPAYKDRLNLFEIFCKHDIFEDTTKEPDLSNSVDKFVLTYLTLPDGKNSKYEFEYLSSNINKIRPEVWYLKTIDKFINLTNTNYFIKKGTLEDYKSYLNFYAREAIKHYPNSFWIQQALCYE